MTPRPFTLPSLEAKFASYPDDADKALRMIREWIFDLAATDPAIGPITEALKWGEPAWLTPSGSGTTIRAGWKAKSSATVAIYFNCNTDLIDRVRSHFDGILECEGNRAIILPLDQPIPSDPIKTCLGWALSYHRDKKAAR